MTNYDKIPMPPFCRVEFCDRLIDMKNEILDFAMMQYTNHYILDDNGEPSGIMYDHMDILAQFMNFQANLNAVPDFNDHVKLVEDGKTRMGSPQVASF